MTKINLEYINELSGGDIDFIISTLKTYLDETGSEIKLLQESFVNNDRARISFWAHKIKASFQMLGLIELTEISTALEGNAKNQNISMELLGKDIDYIVENAEQSFQHAKRLLKDF